MTGDRRDGGDTSSWWRTTIEPWWRDFDELGHMTAAAYPAVFEEAFGRFVIERWDRYDPQYVVARTAIDYLHEVTRATLPVEVRLAPAHIGTSSAVFELVLLDSRGRLCTRAETRYVAWDGERRRSRPYTTEERSAFQRPGPD